MGGLKLTKTLTLHYKTSNYVASCLHILLVVLGLGPGCQFIGPGVNAFVARGYANIGDMSHLIMGGAPGGQMWNL